MRDINLLPEEIRPGNETTEKIKEKVKVSISTKTIIIAALTIVIMVVLILIPIIYIKAVDLSIASVDRQLSNKAYKEIKDINAELIAAKAALDSKKQIIKSVDKYSYPVNEITSSLSKVSPKGLEINSVEYDSNSVIITGNAMSSLQASEFLINVDRLEFLSANNMLANVTIDKSNSRCRFEYTFNVDRKGGK
ncbi:MAG: PilN domain-containing protein [Clostridia bacterium]|nr:PilN domain-containing protein [Clostridia bacterium]